MRDTETRERNQVNERAEKEASQEREREKHRVAANKISTL